LEKNAVKQKKHRKSLSLEQKDQIKSINAVAHKKQYDLLSPEKKARRVEIGAEQHHEHLTEEEKKIAAQIRSVAATLYEKVDLDKPTVEFLREHFYKNPTLALTNFYCCSTDPCVAIFNDELQPDVDKSFVWNSRLGVPLDKKKRCFAKRHSTTLTNHIQGLLPVHLVVNAF
jgi:hypothetical protein